MPVCVAGMPHSGISTVGLALGVLGVDLGPNHGPPLEAPYKDRSGVGARFTSVNDAILDALGASWSSPPEDGGAWLGLPQLEPLKESTRALADSLALAEPWGWVDPLNSLTLSFWRELFPDLQIVVCVRHPLTLADSLEAAGAASVPKALELWCAYYEAVDDRCVVTGVSRLAEDPRGELVRVAQELHLTPSSAELQEAAGALEGLAGDASPSEGELPVEVERLYERLLATGPPRSAPEQKLEIAHLRRELERAQARIEDLRADAEAHTGWQRERDNLLANLEEQLLERDEDLKRARDENEWRRGIESALREENRSLREENRWLGEKEEEARTQLDSMQQTRLWRLGTGYWSFKDRLGGRLRRVR
jgi:hypothetical protein